MHFNRSELYGYETIEKTKQYQMRNNLQIDGIARNQDQSQDISKRIIL